MTKLIVTLALAAVAAAPAFATTHAKKKDSARAAYAAVYSPVVIVDGKIVGADPDPNIREQLIRDHDLLAD